MERKKPELDIVKFMAILERFADNLRSIGELKAAEAVGSILKYVRGHKTPTGTGQGERSDNG